MFPPSDGTSVPTLRVATYTSTIPVGEKQGTASLSWSEAVTRPHHGPWPHSQSQRYMSSAWTLNQQTKLAHGELMDGSIRAMSSWRSDRTLKKRRWPAMIPESPTCTQTKLSSCAQCLSWLETTFGKDWDSTSKLPCERIRNIIFQCGTDTRPQRTVAVQK